MSNEEETQLELKYPEYESESESTPLESSSSNSDSDSDDEPLSYTRPRGTAQETGPDDSDSENTAESNIRRFTKMLNSKRLRKERDEEEEDYVHYEDPENWREEDLKELWEDAPIGMTNPGWDPNWVDEEEVDIISDGIKAVRDPPIAPFCVPYRKCFPVIPDNHHDISNPKAVIEELDRIEDRGGSSLRRAPAAARAGSVENDFF